MRAVSGSEALKVLTTQRASPPSKYDSTMINDALEELGVQVDQYSLRRLFLGGYDILQLQVARGHRGFPLDRVGGGGADPPARPPSWSPGFGFRISVVWTIHNAGSHEMPHPRASKRSSCVPS